MIAGVRVGEVEKLTIEEPFARVDMRLENGVQIPRDSWVAKRTASAFGDAYIEIIPPEDEGTANVARLGNGEQIERVLQTGSTDSVLRAADRGLPRLDHALDDTDDFVRSGRHWINSAARGAIDRASDWLVDGKIEAGMASADHAVTRLESGTDRAASATADLGPRVNSKLDSFEKGIASTRTKIADVKSGLHDGLQRTRDSLNNIDEQVADYRDAIDAVNQGKGDDAKGQLGRLINDQEIGGDIQDAVQTGRDGADRLTRAKAWLGMRIEYNVYSKAARFYATAELRQRNDKFYLVELERDPLGGLPSDNLADQPGDSSFTRTITIKDQLRFTAQFGKQFGWLALRGGIKDSEFGLGADALLLNGGRLTLSADVFGGFSTNYPTLKLTAAFAVFRSIYVIAGINDALSTPGYLQIDKDSQAVPNDFQVLRYGRDYFLGGTLHFDDADLATLLRVYGALLVSALK